MDLINAEIVPYIQGMTSSVQGEVGFGGLIFIILLVPFYLPPSRPISLHLALV